MTICQKRFASVLAVLTLVTIVVGLNALLPANHAQAANPTNACCLPEVELGVQIITPTVSSALTIPQGARHAEFIVEAGDVLVRWNGSIPADATAFKWPEGHMRKESNDQGKLINLRLLNAPGETATVRVQYFGDRRTPAP